MNFRDQSKLELFVLFFIAVLVAAPQSAVALDSIALEFGSAESDEDAERYGVAFKWDWSAQWFTGGNWYLGGYWEAAASYWDGEDGRNRK